MTLTPNPSDKFTVASVNFATGVQQRCGNYGIGYGESTEGEETYIIWDLTTRTIVAEGTGHPEWNDPSLADLNNVITGNAAWMCVDSSGTLWGFDDADVEVYQAVLLSLPLGQTSPVSHGGWLLASGETDTPNGANAFSTPLGDVVVWNGTLYTGAGVIVRYLHNGVITSLVSGDETGVAMDLSTSSLIQDPWGDLWAVGTARGPDPKSELTFWRFFSCGESPIAGDIHTVTGLPVTTSQIGIVRAMFNLEGNLVCKWLDTFDATWETSSQFFRIDTATWTLDEVFSVAADEIAGTKTALTVQSPPALPATYVVIEVVIGDYDDTAIGLLDLITNETQFFHDFWGDWELGDVYAYVLKYDEQYNALIAELPDSGETAWLAFGQSALAGVLNTEVVVEAGAAGLSITQFAPIIVQPYMRGKSYQYLVASISAPVGPSFGVKVKALTFDPPPPPPSAFDIVKHENKPKGGRMAQVIDVRKGGGDLVVLGKAVVLPASTTDGPVQPMEASIRFNPDINSVELYYDDAWHTLTGGSAPVLTMNPNRILGRTAAGTGQPQEIVVGEGLLLASGSLSSSFSAASFYPNRGTKRGTFGNGSVIPLGLVAMTSTASEIFTSAHALVAATAACRATIMKQTGNSAPVVVGYFDWEAGDYEATVTLIAPSLTAKDALWIAGPATGDTTLAHFAFLVMA